MSQPKIGNPAVVGLAGFGLTTILLQMTSLGFLPSKGPILACALIFGGLAQLLAGFQEQKVGNNFGYSAFVSYGCFWISLATIWILNACGIYKTTPYDAGIYYIPWAAYTALMFLASLRVHTAMAVTFALVLVGFILLIIGHVGHLELVDQIAAYELIFAGLAAWYMMAAIIINDLAGRTLLPLGQPLLKKAASPATPTPTKDALSCIEVEAELNASKR